MNSYDNIIKPIDININTDLGDVNKAIESLLKAAAKSLPKALNLQNDVDNNKVRINVVKIFPNKTEMLVKNRIARDKEMETYRFDFNFLLSYTGENNLFKLFFDQFNAKKYDVAVVDIYGAALRNGVWKGKRITGAKTD
ncbi:MAG: hypothetical protein L3J08_02375 [Flavobacteriaceae bacterium]|nr:hypothetical protein [Flavobacteriaceae bacterium]